jgi:hypothetical protein
MIMITISAGDDVVLLLRFERCRRRRCCCRLLLSLLLQLLFLFLLLMMQLMLLLLLLSDRLPVAPIALVHACQQERFDLLEARQSFQGCMECLETLELLDGWTRVDQSDQSCVETDVEESWRQQPVARQLVQGGGVVLLRLAHRGCLRQGAREDFCVEHRVQMGFEGQLELHAQQSARGRLRRDSTGD